MNETNLKKAIRLGKSGDKFEASQLLIDVIKQEPRNEIAWLWLATCVDTNDKKLFCVKKVLGPWAKDLRRRLHERRVLSMDYL